MSPYLFALFYSEQLFLCVVNVDAVYHSALVSPGTWGFYVCKCIVTITVQVIGHSHCKTLRCGLIANTILINGELVLNYVEELFSCSDTSLTCQKVSFQYFGKPSYTRMQSYQYPSQGKNLCSLKCKLQVLLCTTWGWTHFLAWFLWSLPHLPLKKHSLTFHDVFWIFVIAKLELAFSSVGWTLEYIQWPLLCSDLWNRCSASLSLLPMYILIACGRKGLESVKKWMLPMLWLCYLIQSPCRSSDVFQCSFLIQAELSDYSCEVMRWIYFMPLILSIASQDSTLSFDWNYSDWNYNSTVICAVVIVQINFLFNQDTNELQWKEVLQESSQLGTEK